MDALAAGLLIGVGILAYKGANMATAKKAVKKTAEKVKPEVSNPGDIKTPFGTFRIDDKGVIHQTGFVSTDKVVDLLDGMPAEEVCNNIRNKKWTS